MIAVCPKCIAPHPTSYFGCWMVKFMNKCWFWVKAGRFCHADKTDHVMNMRLCVVEFQGSDTVKYILAVGSGSLNLSVASEVIKLD